MTRAPNLGISVQREHGDASVSPLSSPRTPHTPGPHSPFQQSFAEGYDLHPHSPITAVPRAPSPKPKASSKSFFSNAKASRSTTKLPKSESPARQPQPQPQRRNSPTESASSQLYGLGRSMGSSPELGLSNGQSGLEGQSAGSKDTDAVDVFNSGSSASAAQLGPSNAPKKKQSKHKFNILGRKGSIKDEDHQFDERGAASRTKPLKSAPEKQKQGRDIRAERPNKDKLASATRARSVDHQMPSEDEGSSHYLNPGHGPQHSGAHTNFRSTGTRAADGLGRAAKGLLGKLSARSNPSDREAKESAARAARDAAIFQDEAQKAYLNKTYGVVNRPLDEQTRTTRICKRLEDCKDKTEFWLPAVAYRCIDFLNDRGMAHEGLYRIPGSEREVRNWLYRFDKFFDIDLLNETELYDVNIISSMFKSWLRDLPEEIFPQSLQDSVIEKVGEQNTKGAAPKALKEQLSNLPPFNYYLLFAVTAHITMLLNASNENKMTFNNLCVCFMPCLKVNHACFSWLILDWKNCWDGCVTEREYLEREYAIQDGRDPNDAGDSVLPEQHFDRYPPPFSKNASNLGDSETVDDNSTLSVADEEPGRSRNAGRAAPKPNVPTIELDTFPSFEFSNHDTDLALSFDRPSTSPEAKRAQGNALHIADLMKPPRHEPSVPVPKDDRSAPSKSTSSRHRRGSEPADSTSIAPNEHRPRLKEGSTSSKNRSNIESGSASGSSTRKKNGSGGQS